uniref:Uncharacterized protein n=1 Tax=viral metagenome TaxID=1070528 RepID=A0A6M3Y4G9_9ZZZZ
MTIIGGTELSEGGKRAAKVVVIVLLIGIVILAASCGLCINSMIG